MTQHCIRVVLPFHLQTLAKIEGELRLDLSAPVTLATLLDALEQAYPMLRGTIRDHITQQRRPLLRYFACSQDLSHVPVETQVPEAVLSGSEPFIIWGAVAGG